MENKKIIEFFDKRAATWDEGFSSNSEIKNIILDNAKVSEGLSILDVGCGTGRLFPDYFDRGVSHVTGIDISEKMIAVAKSKFDEANVSLLCADADTVTFNRMYDICIIYNVFPHLSNPESSIQNLSAFIKTGGILTIAHGKSREQVDSHHQHLGSEVVAMLLPDNEMIDLLSKNFEDIRIISNERMYQIVCVKK